MRGAANLIGHDVGPARMPFTEVTGAERDRLAAVLRAVGLTETGEERAEAATAG
jgi:hypothetical protein